MGPNADRFCSSMCAILFFLWLNIDVYINFMCEDLENKKEGKTKFTHKNIPLFIYHFTTIFFFCYYSLLHFFIFFYNYYIFWSCLGVLNFVYARVTSIDAVLFAIVPAA